MPVDMNRYPETWKQISHYIRFERAGGFCEWCGVKHGTYGARNADGDFISQDILDKVERMQSDAGYAYLESLGFADGYPEKLIKIILTTAHIGIPPCPGVPGDKHNKMDVRCNNLKALCQQCHLRFDIKEHIENRRETMYQRKHDAMQEAGNQLLSVFENLVQG